MNISPDTVTTPGSMLIDLAQRLPWLAPSLLVVHLISVAMVVGSVVIFDLRVLGLWRRIDVRDLHGVLIPVALLFTLPAAASGALLFSFHANDLVGDGVFVLKMVALFAAAINAMIFATGPWQSMRKAENAGAAGAGACFCAVLSMALLLAVATLGVTLAGHIARL